MKIIYYRHNKASGTVPQIAKGKINFAELTLVLKGKLDYTVNGEQISVLSGDCIFIKAGSERFRKEGSFSDYVSINFEATENISTVYFKDAISSDVRFIINACDEIIERYFGWEDKIADLVSLLIKILGEKENQVKENPLILKLKNFIFKNYSKKISLSTVAKEMGYSPNYLDTLFKKETGVPISDFIIKHRVTEAKRLLAEGVLPLKTIAEEVGFLDYNYFARTFKKRCGYTPREYKDSLK